MPRPCHAPTMPFFSRPQHSTAVERRPCCAVALRRTAWSEHGMASVNQTRPHCVNQNGKTHYKPLAARHGRGTLCVNRPLDFHYPCRSWAEMDWLSALHDLPFSVPKTATCGDICSARFTSRASPYRGKRWTVGVRH